MKEEPPTRHLVAIKLGKNPVKPLSPAFTGLYQVSPVFTGLLLSFAGFYAVEGLGSVAFRRRRRNTSPANGRIRFAAVRRFVTGVVLRAAHSDFLFLRWHSNAVLVRKRIYFTGYRNHLSAVSLSAVIDERCFAVVNGTIPK